MYGGGARNRRHRNAPKVGGDGDEHICVYADLRRISVKPIARTAAVHQRRHGAFVTTGSRSENKPKNTPNSTLIYVI